MKLNTGVIIVILTSFSLPLFAADNEKYLEDRIVQLENRLNELAKNSDAQKDGDSLIHMSGYADVGMVKKSSEDSSFNAGTFAPIFHFQYQDLVMLEAELEIETTETGDTEVMLEYLSIDWFLNDYMTLVAGKFLSPVGQFRQNLHPSWINKLASAPAGFGHDGAAPVSEVGVQLRGGMPLGSMRSTYAVYISNGPELNVVDEDGEMELEGIEAEGFGMDRDGKKTAGIRVSLLPLPMFEIGVSAASGKAAVTSVVDESVGTKNEILGQEPRDYDVAGADFVVNFKRVEVRGEYVATRVGESNVGVTASEAAEWKTWYSQAMYRIKPGKWEGVVRFTDFDSPHDSEDVEQVAIGVNYLISNNFIAKLGYENNKGLAGSESNAESALAQLAYGF